MKTIQYIAIGLAGAAIAFSCSLKTDPTTLYTVETFWNSPEGCEAAMSGCYNVLVNAALFGEAAPLLEETCTPNAYNYNNQGGFNDIAKGTHTSASSGIIANRWDACYKGIGRCNTHLDRLPGADVTEERRRTMEGETKFLRALYYYMLVQYYNGVPLILHEPVYSDGSVPRSSRELVVAAILDDLDDAAGLLDWTWKSASDQGRATRGAALGLKARLLLFEASPLLNPSADKAKWQQAADVCLEIIRHEEEAGYGLFNDYRRLFLPANEHSKECVFNVEFSKTKNTPGNEYTVYCTQYRNNAPLLDIVSAYETLDGGPRTISTYTGLDPRFAASVFYPGCTWFGIANAPAETVCSFTGFACKKMSIYNGEKRGTGDLLEEKEMNYMFIRYADILLMYAEALNEAEGSLDEIHSAVDRVRLRAGVAPLPSGMTRGELREAIRHERRVEFAFEGLYYNDIRRWKTIEQVNNGVIRDYRGNVVGVRSFDPDRDYWWPIPQDEIRLNPALKQNPKY